MGLKDWFKAASGETNVDRILRAIDIAESEEFAALLADDQQVKAVRILRQRVPGLGLVDAAAVIRRARQR